MNRYPAWKYILIGIALLVGVIYTAPNLFGVVPAVAVSGVRAANKVDEPMKATLDAALKDANVPVLSSEIDSNGSAHFRFADTDRQIAGRDAITA